MAAKVWYATDVGNNCRLSETSPGAEGYTSSPIGWIVSTGAGVDYSPLAIATGEQAAASFGATVHPDASLDAVGIDHLRTETTYNGSFAAANWTIDFAVRAQTNGGAHDGAAGFRLFRSVNADGSSATEITAAVQQGSTVTDLATSATQKSSVTFNPGAITLTNEYLFIEVGWKRLGAGGMTSADVNLRIGTGATVITSSDFTAAGGGSDAVPQCWAGYRARRNH